MGLGVWDQGVGVHADAHLKAVNDLIESKAGSAGSNILCHLWR
jgi:hypothetical protein